MGVEVNLAECKEIAPGVFQKNTKTFYIKCAASGTICYCNEVRLKKLIEKYGSIEAIGQKYISREGKQLSKPVARRIENRSELGSLIGEYDEPIKMPKDKKALIESRKLAEIEEQKKREAAARHTEKIKERVKSISTPYIGTRPITPEEMLATDVCWVPQYWTEYKFCDGCKLKNMCGCLTKVFKKKQK